MKKLLLILLGLLPFATYSQTGYETSRNNGVNQTVERYLINSPGNMIGNSRVVWRTHDSTWIEWIFANAYFRNLPNTKDDGVPVNIMHTASDGRLLVSPISYLYPDTINKFVTKSYLTNNFYNQAQSDMRYLQSYNELDPLSLHLSDTSLIFSNIYNKINTKLDYRYLPANFDTLNNNEIQALSGNNRTINLTLGGSYTIPQTVWDSVLNKPILLDSNILYTKYRSDTSRTNIYNSISLKQNQLNGVGFVKSNGTNITYDNSTYLTSFTELDPTVPSYVKSITPTNISTWNNALQSEVDGSVTNELQTLNLASSTLSISNGNSVNLSGFVQVNSDWNSISGVSQILNKPIIPAQVNITGGLNNKVTGSYPNITIADSFTTRIYNTSGAISQSLKIWSDIVTPSTSNGYSINISSAGFTNILSAHVIAIRNTSSASSSPNVSIKSMSNTAIVVNVVEDNPATVAILGISVLSGLPSIFANITGLTLSVIVIGY